MSIEEIQENLSKLDDEYLNVLFPKHQLLQSALEQLRNDEQKLLELQAKTNSSDTDIVGISENEKKQPESKRLSDEAADRLAQALFHVDDESSDTSSDAG